MAEVVVLQGAEDDSLSIYFAIFESNPDRAEKFSSAIDHALSDLSRFPEIGRSVTKPFRRKLVPGFYEYGIFYVKETDRVVVHAVLNLRQEPAQIMKRLGL